MKVKHFLPSSFLNRPIKIIVVGAGGTGSALIPRLMQIDYALKSTGHSFGLQVEVYDDDEVSESNIGRQGFLPCDVGQKKALVLINRLNMGWNTQWKGYSQRVTERTNLAADFVIGCVDTRKARASILKALSSARSPTYYIDSGNAEYSGQVVIGEVLKRSGTKYRLPHIGDLFPEMVNASLDAADDKPSCSVAESLRKQSLAINMTMATEVLNILWTLLHTGQLNYSGRFIDLTNGTSAPIKLDTEVWKRMGYDAALPEQAEAATA